MSEKTIQEIEAAFGERAAGILGAFYDAKDEISRQIESVEGPHADIFTDRQRAEITRTQKAERARAKAEESRKQYQQLQTERNEAVRARTRVLREQLFGVEDGGALARAAVATDTQLGGMLELAIHADNADLARAVFAAASQRELGDLMNRYFERVNPEAGELYREWRSAPSEEDLERRLEDAETLFAAPDASYFATAPIFS
jgi:hypothetical protein